MGYVSTRWRGLTFFPPLRKASVPRSSWISKRISLKTLRKLKKNPVGKNYLALRRKRGFADAKSTTSCTFVLSVLMSCSGNRVACESILVETRWLDPTYFLHFVQDAFSKACFLSDLRDKAIRDFPFLFSLTDYPVKGHHINCVRAGYPCAFFLFPPASALQSTRVKGHFISIRGFNRFLITHTGEADRIRTKRVASTMTSGMRNNGSSVISRVLMAAPSE